ncbi:hypothetical protein [Paenibacillus sp. 32O-W]|nr:hypothetical protein [Paenibacillus sp. 32O-W]
MTFTLNDSRKSVKKEIAFAALKIVQAQNVNPVWSPDYQKKGEALKELVE